jgi:protein-S-isoprenylcysteine O-methyltransferase Ste14
MFVAFRAAIYSILFIAFLLIYLPARVLFWCGIRRPPRLGAPQVFGMITGTIGGLIALWCIVTFVRMGRGTPAPFDPPRRLVICGPYQFVRNPMHLGAAIALTGAAVFYGSLTFFAYSCAFLLACHLFVVLYEEPTLQRTFGREYEDYLDRVGRWWPALR